MELNLPTYPLRIKKLSGKSVVFDAFRKKWVALTPEEWVRQHFITYLVQDKGYPKSLVAVEYSLNINQNDFRSDAVVFSRIGTPILIVECKAPEVKITQQVFDQIARYNLMFQVSFLIVTNGINHYCCRFDKDNQTYTFLNDIPSYEQIGANLSC